MSPVRRYRRERLLLGEETQDYLAYAAGAGDVNGDGYGDLVVGAASNDDGGVDAGQSYLVYGPAYGTFDITQADAFFIGEDAGDRARALAKTSGDLDGDGLDDLLIGAWGNDAGGSDAGAAYIIYASQ